MKHNDLIDLAFRIVLLASLFWAIVTIAHYLAGCGPLPIRPDDATIRQGCRAACDNMARLEYPGYEGSPGEDEIHGTADDIACWLVCESTEMANFPFHARCLAESATGEEMDRCYN